MHLDCLDPADPLVITIGSPVSKFLSQQPYDSTQLMYSDHAPIVYKFQYAPPPVKNDYINIITWNVGIWGNTHFSSSDSYNHKFNMKARESIYDYKKRMNNLVGAFMELLTYRDNQPKEGHNLPFLFCQELPSINSFYFKGLETQQDIHIPLRQYFLTLLSSNGLDIVCDISGEYEFGLIVKLGTPFLQRFFVLNKKDYLGFTYSDKKQIFPRAKGHTDYKRFEIYYYTTDIRGEKHTFYYVNIHAGFTINTEYGKYNQEDGIIEFLTKILDVIQINHMQYNLHINNVSVYFIGDFNYNITSPKLNEYVSSAPSGGSYTPTLHTLLCASELRRQIISIHKLTTQNAEGFSLIDNAGNRSPCNIDCILKLDLASS